MLGNTGKGKVANSTHKLHPSMNIILVISDDMCLGGSSKITILIEKSEYPQHNTSAQQTQHNKRLPWCVILTTINEGGSRNREQRKEWNCYNTKYLQDVLKQHRSIAHSSHFSHNFAQYTTLYNPTPTTLTNSPTIHTQLFTNPCCGGCSGIISHAKQAITGNKNKNTKFLIVLRLLLSVVVVLLISLILLDEFDIEISRDEVVSSSGNLPLLVFKFLEGAFAWSLSLKN